MTYFDGATRRMKAGSRIAWLVGMAALLTLPTFADSSSAQAETRRVDIDCNQEQSKKVILGPIEDRVEITFTTSCHCSESAQGLKHDLTMFAVSTIAAATLGEDPEELDYGGSINYSYPVAPGEKMEITFYCYTDAQLSSYSDQVDQAIDQAISGD